MTWVAVKIMTRTIRTVDIREAKKHLSRLIEQAAKGEPFIIAIDDKPMVQVAAIDAVPSRVIRRTGFLAGYISVPDDFDQMDADKVCADFHGVEGKQERP